MEGLRYRSRRVICVVLVGLIAFSCCIAAEFKKAKDKDVKLDGSLCSMPIRPAFALGVAALLCLSVAQIVGTSSAATKLKSKTQLQALSITFLLLSWISFALAAILLGAASSMNSWQRYGRGWMDGECYVVKDFHGVFIGAAILAASTVLFIIGFALTTAKEIPSPGQRPDEEEQIHTQQQHKEQH